MIPKRLVIDAATDGPLPSPLLLLLPLVLVGSLDRVFTGRYTRSIHLNFDFAKLGVSQTAALDVEQACSHLGPSLRGTPC